MLREGPAPWPHEPGLHLLLETLTLAGLALFQVLGFLPAELSAWYQSQRPARASDALDLQCFLEASVNKSTLAVGRKFGAFSFMSFLSELSKILGS